MAKPTKEERDKIVTLLEDGFKFCIGCSRELPVDMFYKVNDKRLTGLTTYCKECKSSKSKSYYSNVIKVYTIKKR